MFMQIILRNTKCGRYYRRVRITYYVTLICRNISEEVLFKHIRATRRTCHDFSNVISSPEPSGSQGQLIVYQLSVVVVIRRPQCYNIFSSETAWPIKAKFYVEPSWGGGGESLYKWSRLHDWDGRHAHIW